MISNVSGHGFGGMYSFYEHDGLDSYGRRPHRIPPSYVGEIVYQEDFDDLAQWDVFNGTEALNTTNVVGSDAATPASYKMTATTGAISAFTLDVISATDLRGCHGNLRVYVHPGSGVSAPTTILYIAIQLRDSAVKIDEYRLLSTDLAGGNPRADEGWYDLDFLVNQPTSAYIPTFDPSDTVRITILVAKNDIDDTPSITLDQLTFYKPRNKVGLVLFRFDTMYTRTKQALAYMEAQTLTGTSRTLKASMMVNEITLGGGSHLTVNEVRDLQARGHEVGMYASLWADLDTDAERLASVKTTQDWMRANGFGKGVNKIAHDTAANFLNNARERLLDRYYDIILAGPGLDSSNAEAVRALWNPKILMWSYFLSDSTNIPAALVQAASKYKGLMVYGAHVTSDAELARFKTDIDTIVTEINKGGLIPVTMEGILTGSGLFEESDQHVISIADTGDGGLGLLTLSPQGKLVKIDCLDAQGCTITMDEQNYTNGYRITVVNVGAANVLNFADTAGISETTGAVALAQYDSLDLLWIGDRWVMQGTSDN